MMKKRSPRTQHFVCNLSKFRKYAAISFPPFKGIHFPWLSARQQNLSRSLSRVGVDDDLREVFIFEVCFSTFCTADVASDDKSSKQ